MVPIRVIIADDQKVCRLGLSTMLKGAPGIELVAEAVSGEALLILVAQHKPDVVLTDIEMSPINGLEATGRISKEFPGTAVIAFSVYNDGYSIMEMLQAGAVGYLVKEAEETVVLEAIRAAHRRDNYFSHTASNVITGLIRAGTFDPKTLENYSFTPHELRVIRLICKNHDSNQIAAELKVGPEAIRKMRRTIYEKAGVDGTPGLVMFAVKKGIYK
jgi:DNA-binding NarL/FixJ family response regulator